MIPLLFVSLFLFCLRPIEDHDIWWHLASGRYMAAHPGIPHQDIFSWTCPGSAWVDNYWLYQRLVYGLYAGGGYSLLIVYKALMAVLIFWPVYLRFRRRGVPTELTAAGVWLTFWGSRLIHTGWSERASLMTLLGVAWLLWHLEEVHEKHKPTKSLWIWVGVFILWANIHPGFLLGLAITGLFAASEILSGSSHRIQWIGWIVVCSIATLATPYGVTTFHTLSAGLAHVSSIMEWRSTPWRNMEIYWITLSVFWASQLLVRRGKELLRWPFIFIAIGLSVASVRHVLYIPFFVNFAMPWVTDFLRKRPEIERIPARPALSRACVTLGILVFGIQGARGISGGINRYSAPVDACRFIDESRLAGPFYNAYAFGGYWIWHFGESRGVFIDGRYPTVEGYIPLWDAIRGAQGGAPEGWDKFLKQWKVNAVLLDHPEFANPGAIYSRYFPETRWTQRYRDGTAVIYVRSVKLAASAAASPDRAR
jgi:hypothetical protein